jgi:hypothetical protein
MGVKVPAVSSPSFPPETAKKHELDFRVFIGQPTNLARGMTQSDNAMRHINARGADRHDITPENFARETGRSTHRRFAVTRV